MATWESYLEENRVRFLDELLDYLRIPSISALPEHAADVERAAQWTADRLRTAGMENVRILPTGGHPVVYADWLHAPDRPTVMIYGHFDVQPVDPLDLWDHPPFEPAVQDGRVYARGATDDKGNLLPAIHAVEALLREQGALPVNIKFFFEGQEEIGSPQLPDFIAANKDLLACDLVLSADGGQLGEDQPAIYLGLRGICALQVDVHGPSHDLHSGGYGGAVHNPIHALVEILASMRGPDGRVRVEGFYDGVTELSIEERAEIARVPFDEDEFKAGVGVQELFGEVGYTPLERTWVRPTLEMNGIWGGFQGAGSKTVLPAQAHAKITCRLVPHQDPAQVMEAIIAHVRANTPPGVTVEVTAHDAGAHAYVIPADHPALQATRDVLVEMYGVEPYHIRMGGTIPVTALFHRELGAYSVIFAFGLLDERTHSPNEFFRLSSYYRSQIAYGRLLLALGERGL
jgi:acetylornithine deacetylase/succinyl-diaminopimelate desuccinylase-like protein